MLLRVFITNCHVSENAKIGPVTSQPATKPPAIPKAHGRPLRVAVSEANFENQCSPFFLAIYVSSKAASGPDWANKDCTLTKLPLRAPACSVLPSLSNAARTRSHQDQA